MKIIEIVKKLKKENGNKYVKNNDLLWYLVGKMDDMEKRISRTEAMQKLMLWIIPVVVAATAIIVRLITER